MGTRQPKPVIIWRFTVDPEIDVYKHYYVPEENVVETFFGWFESLENSGTLELTKFEFKDWDEYEQFREDQNIQEH